MDNLIWRTNYEQNQQRIYKLLVQLFHGLINKSVWEKLISSIFCLLYLFIVCPFICTWTRMSNFETSLRDLKLYVGCFLVMLLYYSCQAFQFVVIEVECHFLVIDFDFRCVLWFNPYLYDIVIFYLFVFFHKNSLLIRCNHGNEINSVSHWCFLNLPWPLHICTGLPGLGVCDFWTVFSLP